MVPEVPEGDPIWRRLSEMKMTLLQYYIVQARSMAMNLRHFRVQSHQARRGVANNNHATVISVAKMFNNNKYYNGHVVSRNFLLYSQTLKEAISRI